MKTFSRKRGKAAPAPSAPPGSRIYAIGDIHGRLDLLERLHDLIRADAAESDAARKVVVYLGDYIDRGPESKGVVELLMNRPLVGFERALLKGNHEVILLEFLDGAEVGAHWCTYGGLQTLESYGVRPLPIRGQPEEFAAARVALAGKIPPAHVEFLRSLPLTHAEGGYLFVHAGLRPGVDLAEQDEHDLLWIRDEFLQADADFGACVVHGHSIAEAPEIRPHRIGIDTGAFATGKLTALVLEGESREFLQT